MANERKRLGQGLEGLISAARERSLSPGLLETSGHRVQAIPAGEVQPNPFQPRRDFDIAALNELVESLRNHGLMQAVIVRKTEDGYQLVAGERRWRASQELGWPQIDAVVIEADDQQMLEWALVENIQREDLGPMEIAHGLHRLTDAFGRTQGEVGKAMGMSRSAVANILRLLELPETIQARVSRGTVSMGAARALLSIGDPRRQEEIARQVEAGGLNVRQVEELARRSRGGQGKPGRGTSKAADPNLASLERDLQALLGTRVTLSGLERGRLVIHYHTGRELDRLVRRLRGEAPSLSGPPEEAETITV